MSLTKITIIISCVLLPQFISAQSVLQSYIYPDSVLTSTPNVYAQSKIYIQNQIERLNIYNSREKVKTQKLLKRLSKKEKRYLNKLQRIDSNTYNALGNKVSFDSIQKLSINTNTYKLGKNSRSKFTGKLDSLRQVNNFAHQFLERSGNQELFDKSSLDQDKLSALENKASASQYIQKLIQGRANDLYAIGDRSGLSNSLKGIKKQTYYYNQNLKEYKRIADDPSIAEQKALDYLCGVQGFESSLDPTTLTLNNKGMGNDMRTAKTEEDLKRMGFQTKRQLNEQLNKQFGTKTPEQLQQINAKINTAKTQLTKYKEHVSSTKSQIKQLGFRPNPMRGIPLKQRLEKSMSWQVFRATKITPAIFEIYAMAGFKHNARITHSFLIGTAFGFGNNWQNIRFSMEGFRAGANMDYKLIWGISGQTGIERIYKKYEYTKMIASENEIPKLVTYKKKYRDIVYAGIQKTYKINSKYSGTILLAYDFFWKQANASTPIIWRMGWKK